MMTAAIQARGPGFIAQAVAAMRRFTDLTPDNDPYGENDFGAFEVEGRRLFFEIDHTPDIEH